MVAAAMEGSSAVEVKLFGPVQEYVALATVLAVRFNVVVAQMGELLPAVGEAGVGFTDRTWVAVFEQLFASVPVSEYVVEVLGLTEIPVLVEPVFHE